MPTYSFYDVQQPMEETFRFLITDYGFEEASREQDNMGFTLLYLNEDRQVRLYYDYRDNFFYFYIIKGINTVYPNDTDKNILSFYNLFQHFEPSIDLKRLEPDEEQYQHALTLNAQLLKKYGDKLLRGEEWLDL